jgi:hypothetical protein
MGNFYTNYTLRGPSQQSVAAALAGRSAIVTPAQDGCVVVFDEESDEQNQEIIAELASRLSGELRCSLLAVLNHDDDILWYQLYLSGELVDEYDSAPGYFDATDEDAAMAGPEGGDAKKLCGAFTANTIAEVESILRKASSDEDGYTFAVERHADLAGALGIPSFGVGASFQSVSNGELPEELSGNDLVRTKDLVAVRPLDRIGCKPIRDYYKVSFRAHPQLKKSIPTGWMPGTWAELECQEQKLSDAFRKATAVHREKFKQLGFAEQGFKNLTRVLNPNSRDMGGINYLDSSRCHFGQLIYNRYYMPSLQSEKESVVISFMAVFQNETFGYTNNPDFFEAVPNQNVVRLQSNDVVFIYEQFVQHLKQRSDLPRQFPDLQSLQTWYDSNALGIFEYRVRRGSWVRMSDYEVAVAQRKLRPPLPNT